MLNWTATFFTRLSSFTELNPKDFASTKLEHLDLVLDCPSQTFSIKNHKGPWSLIQSPPWAGFSQAEGEPVTLHYCNIDWDIWDSNSNLQTREHVTLTTAPQVHFILNSKHEIKNTITKVDGIIFNKKKKRKKQNWWQQ